MKFHPVILLIFATLTCAARNTVEQRALPPIDPVGTGRASTNSEPTVTPTTPTTTSSTVTPPTTSNPPNSAPTSATNSNSLSSVTGVPSLTSDSISLTSDSSNTGTSQTSSNDQPITSTVVVPGSDSSSSTSTSSSATPSNTDGNGENNSSVGTGTIVGLSVAGGIAVFGAVAFVIWKFTRKRFSEFDADGEEIRWPELGHESHALPTRQTGRAGVDDDGYDDAGIGGAGRQLGNYPPSSNTGETSMADLHAYNDPYAVPPLPHLDPNQPYHDDPSNYGGHYDPYQGPVPQSFHDSTSVDRMSASSPAPVNFGRQSPGPAASYTRTGY